MTQELKDTIDNGESEVQITTIGTVIGTGADGEPVEQNLTENALQALAEKHKDDEILVDVDHESETSNKTEAKGWLSKLKFIPGKGLWGTIKWTDIGRKLVENRVFRWLSPSWYLNKDTKEPTQMTSVALTNKPSQAGRIEPIVNSAPVELTDDNIITMELTKEELIELIKQTIIDLKKEKKVEELEEAIENENEVHENIVENLEDEKKAVETGTMPVDAINSASNTCGKTEEKVENECGDVTKNEDTVEEEVDSQGESIKEELKEGTEDDKTEDVKEEIKEEIKEEKEEEKEEKKDETKKTEPEQEEVIKVEALNAKPKTFGMDIIQNTGANKPRYEGEGYAIVTRVN